MEKGSSTDSSRGTADIDHIPEQSGININAHNDTLHRNSCSQQKNVVGRTKFRLRRLNDAEATSSSSADSIFGKNHFTTLTWCREQGPDTKRKKICVKTICGRSIDEGSLRLLMREQHILPLLDHPNIIKLRHQVRVGRASRCVCVLVCVLISPHES